MAFVKGFFSAITIDTFGIYYLTQVIHLNCNYQSYYGFYVFGK